MSALPPKLDRLRKSQIKNPKDETAREIITEYFQFFGKEKVSEELWLLTTGTLTNEEVCQAQHAKDRHDLIFFYEFTKMVLESTYYLHKREVDITKESMIK